MFSLQNIGVFGYLKIVNDGTIITTIYDDDISKYATMTGTAIIQMEAGQKVSDSLLFCCMQLATMQYIFVLMQLKSIYNLKTVF